MLDGAAFTQLLANFDYGIDNIPAQALHAIKRAIIDLLRNPVDSEAIFLGTLLTDIQRINNIDIARTRMSIKNGQLTLELNPYWICYLEKLGSAYVIRELRHELTHIVLMHPESLKTYTNTLQNCIVSIGMNICVNEHLDKITGIGQAAPLCPACVFAKFNKKIPDGRGILPNNIANNTCQVCLGTGELDVTLNKVLKICKAHRGSVSRPYKTTAFDFKPFAKAISTEAPTPALSDKSNPNIYMLADKMLEYPDTYSKAVVDSLVNHAMSQSRSFDKGLSGSGGLLDLLKSVRREKKVPYLLQIKGVLGASMKDESEATRFRPNRRFGYEYPGSKSVPKQRYVFAIDTSGSLPLDELRKMLNEFLNIRAYSDKIECRIIFFHHEVYYDKEISEYTDSDLQKMQSGGTDFDNVLSAVYLDKESKDKGNAVLMMYTDGYCSITIPRRKVGKDIYWLITPGGDSNYIKKWDRDARIIRIEKEKDHGTDIFE